MKTVDEIYQEMLACFGERTGLEPREGCDLSARLYAVAAQVWSLYVQAEWVVRQAFPQTAEGEYLDCGGDGPLCCGRDGGIFQRDSSGDGVYDRRAGAV